MVTEPFDSIPSPAKPPQSFLPIASPAIHPEPFGTLTPSNKSQRDKWPIVPRKVLVSVICLILVGGIAIGLITGSIQSLFLGGQSTLVGSIVSVNPSTGTLVMSVNGQQDMIKNVPANVIQLLQSQVGIVYAIQVTPNIDGSFSMVSDSNVVLSNNGGTPTTNNTSAVSSGNTQTPTTAIEPGSMTFYGSVQSAGNNSLVVTMPTGGTLAFTTNSSTNLLDWNNGLPSVGTQVKVAVTANSDGSFTATVVGNVDAANDTTQAIYTGVTTAAVGSDHVIHFTVGNKSFSFSIASNADLSAFNGNIANGTTVTVTVQFSGSTGSVIQVR